ncbi:MAG: hypothetical protein IPO69_22190 [Saprospiraceae bacterium]|nr:hypothetical protein [Saprospiraceae bacterium]
MILKSYIAWAVFGSICWILFGTGALVLHTFEPMIISLPLQYSRFTVLIAIVVFGLIGALLGIGSRNYLENSIGLDTPENHLTLFLAFWGAVIGGITFGMYFLLPSVNGAEIVSIFPRCGTGVVVGLLAGGSTSLFARSIRQDQLTESGVRAMIRNISWVHTEIFQFFEPTTIIMFGQEMFIPNVMGEFRDQEVAIVYGNGVGHAFVNVRIVRSVAFELGSSNLNWRNLVKSLKKSGYRVKHINYFTTIRD